MGSIITDGLVVAKVSGNYSIDAAGSVGSTSIVVDDGSGARATPQMKAGDKISINGNTYTIGTVTTGTTEDTYPITPSLVTAVTDGTAVTWLDPTRWQGDSDSLPEDINPLYPPAGTYISDPTPDSMPSGREHEIRQWRTLRDNLAAAQSTAVYHYRADHDGDGTVEADEGGTFPVACMASTTHSGTAATDRSSRTFTFVDTNGDGTVNSSDGPRVNFLQGQGTNGLEFAAPFNGDGDTFKTEINKADSPLRVALTNLAYFAGDPNGAFPAAQGILSGSMDTIDEAIHPYPLFTMWGNYSELRRVLNLLSSGTKTYETLSPADQSTLHTASCTLGMLAYSLQVESLYSPSIEDTFQEDIQDEIDDIQDEYLTSSPKLQSLAVHADSFLNLTSTAFGGQCPGETTGSKYEIDNLLTADARWGGDGCYSPQEWWDNEVAASRQSGSFPYTTYDAFLAVHSKAYYASFTADDWDKALTTSGLGNAGLSGTDLVNYNKLKTAIKDYENAVLTIRNGSKTTATTVTDQLRRDRMFGFAAGSPKIDLVPPSLDEVLGGAGTLNGDAVTFFNQGWDPDTGTLVYPTIDAENTTQAGNSFSLGCSPGSVSLGLSALNPNSELGLLTLAMSVCGPYNPQVYGDDDTSSNQTATIRYPSLHYLFPLAAHYHNGAFVANGDGYTSVRTAALALDIAEANQDGTGNNYPSDAYIRDFSVNGKTTIKYRPVEDGLGDCGGIGCSVNSSERDGVVNADDDDEEIGDFVYYLGVKPTTVTNWKTPVQTNTATITSNSFVNDRHLIFVDADGDGTIGTGETLRPAFIDMGLFNSREQMSVRTLRLDLDQMRQKAIGNTDCTWETPSNDTDDSNGLCWLPLPTLLESTGATTNTGAIIYAFREDAVREDAIVRPTTETLTCAADYTTWQTRWNTIATASAASDLAVANLVPYFTDAIGNLLGQTTPAPQDPPVNPCTLVSPKPVDFYADPDRRPHGFMLTNGSDLRRRASSTNWDQDARGMSFISDNPVYIHGDFNIHSEASNTQAASLTNRIEEFDKDTASQLLDATWSNFYTRSTLDTNFARAKDTGSTDVDTDSLADTWRVSAIVSDAVTVLSNNFVPGYIDRGILWNSADSNFNTQNSYGGIRILRDNAGSTDNSSEVHGSKLWWREDESAVTGTQSSPIKFSRRGLPIYYSSSGTPIEYATTPSPSPAENFESITSVKTRDRINDATATWVNTVIVSGLSPSRNTQDTGGLNNFVRQIEDWSGQSLNIFGSLVQLNFSVSTGPFDQDSWQPRTLASGEANQYYNQPNRNFGFDVGLLYVPPDPVASRFSSPSNIRSEFYQELAIDDPYIINLRCARRDYNGDGQITTADATAAGDLNGDGTTDLQDAQVDPNATTCSP